MCRTHKGPAREHGAAPGPARTRRGPGPGADQGPGADPARPGADPARPGADPARPGPASQPGAR